MPNKEVIQYRAQALACDAMDLLLLVKNSADGEPHMESLRQVLSDLRAASLMAEEVPPLAKALQHLAECCERSGWLLAEVEHEIAQTGNAEVLLLREARDIVATAWDLEL